MIVIDSIHIGQPQTITDEAGSWRSSIFRQPVTGPIELGWRGLVGDQVTDTRHHGSPDKAVCCQPIEYYDYWNRYYGLKGSERALGPGSVGENWTLVGADETEICVGDIYAVGSARVQVSGPRIPCNKPGRKLGLPDLQQRILETLRTGFYLRVLQPGIVAAGNVWTLLERPHPGLTLRRLNACGHHEFNPVLAQQLIEAQGLGDNWRRLLRNKLTAHRT